MTREKLARTEPNAIYDKSCLNVTDEETEESESWGETRLNVMRESFFLVPCLGLMRFEGWCYFSPESPRTILFWGP